ncbi:hypothetical protein FN846DRAFT_1001300 [Sphaerosporella brunnea]|uniref:Uncharacterized protein n=1 Tax=Sphaerosporella brunnea TaxID=1250544 RepID=A0A5J5EEU7_9PEZI|nr:hypothetical protein FN846DRAFT_1001300 [Sphaerosporella brunnea]
MPPRYPLPPRRDTVDVSPARTRRYGPPLTTRRAPKIDATARTAVRPQPRHRPRALYRHIFVSHVYARSRPWRTCCGDAARAVVQTEDRVREWGARVRLRAGVAIWRDGTEGAALSPRGADVRIDEVIAMLRACRKPCHFLRAFAKRCCFPLEMNVVLTLDPGGMVWLGYAHERVRSPPGAGGVWELVEAAENKGYDGEEAGSI